MHAKLIFVRKKVFRSWTIEFDTLLIERIYKLLLDEKE